MIGKKIIICMASLISLSAIFLLLYYNVLCFGGQEDKKGKGIINNAAEHGMNYESNSVTNRKVTIEDVMKIRLGSSLDEIAEKLGEPDRWIGSGILRPVYSLEGSDQYVGIDYDVRTGRLRHIYSLELKNAVVLYFKENMRCENLWRVVLYDENGETQIIKIDINLVKERTRI